MLFAPSSGPPTRQGSTRPAARVDPCLVGGLAAWALRTEPSLLGIVSRPTIEMGGRAISGGARYALSMSTPHPSAATSAPYAVLRVDRRKAKAMAAIAASSARTMREKPTPNADPKGAAPVVMHLADGKTPYQAARHLLEGAERHNRDTVLCREIVLFASPSYFRPGRESMGGVFELDRVRAWATASLAWAERQWLDQLASMILHLDEQTPHLHLLVVPRVKAATGWKLNNKALFDRERLRELRTANLIRGGVGAAGNPARGAREPGSALGGAPVLWGGAGCEGVTPAGQDTTGTEGARASQRHRCGGG